MMIPAGKRQEQALAEKVWYPIKSADEKKIMCNLSMLTADVFLFLFSLALNKSPSVFIWYALDLDAISNEKIEGL